MSPPPLPLDTLTDAARTLDYFEVLSLPRSCSGEEALRAADALLAALERLPRRPGATGDDGRADVRLVVLDARAVLGDDTLREAYRKGLSAHRAPTGAAVTPVAPPPA